MWKLVIVWMDQTIMIDTYADKESAESAFECETLGENMAEEIVAAYLTEQTERGNIHRIERYWPM